MPNINVFKRQIETNFYINFCSDFDIKKFENNNKNTLHFIHDFGDIASAEYGKFLLSICSILKLKIYLISDDVFRAKSYEIIERIIKDNFANNKEITNNSWTLSLRLAEPVLNAYFDEYEPLRNKRENCFYERFQKIMKEEFSKIEQSFEKMGDFPAKEKYQKFFNECKFASTYESLKMIFDNFFMTKKSICPYLIKINTELRHFKERRFVLRGFDIKRESNNQHTIKNLFDQIVVYFRKWIEEEKKLGNYCYTDLIKFLTEKSEIIREKLKIHNLIFSSNVINEDEVTFFNAIVQNKLVLIEDKTLIPEFTFGNDAFIPRIKKDLVIIINKKGRAVNFEKKQDTDRQDYLLLKSPKKNENICFLFLSELSYRDIDYYARNNKTKLRMIEPYKYSEIIKEIKKICLFSLKSEIITQIKGLDRDDITFLKAVKNKGINLILRENKDFLTILFGKVLDDQVFKKLISSKKEFLFLVHIKKKLTKIACSPLVLYLFLDALDPNIFFFNIKKNEIYCAKYAENVIFGEFDNLFFLDFGNIYDFSNAKRYDYLPKHGFFAELTTIYNSRMNPIYMHAREKFLKIENEKRSLLRSFLLYIGKEKVIVNKKKAYF